LKSKNNGELIMDTEEKFKRQSFGKCVRCDMAFSYLDQVVCPRCQTNVLTLKKETGLQRVAKAIHALETSAPPVTPFSSGAHLGLCVALEIIRKEIALEEHKCRLDVHYLEDAKIKADNEKLNIEKTSLKGENDDKDK
jgi:DNA-directed RNA polymerase subunit RPC12/RpoP